MAAGNAGFSVLEIAVALLIVAVLAVLAGAGWGSAKRKGALMREIAAGKNLITAYGLYELDHNGQFMRGMDWTQSQVWYEPSGKYLAMMHLANRYPYRLAPYFNYEMEGTILVNGNAAQIEKIAPKGQFMHEYVVSTFPALGMNLNYVGGDYVQIGQVDANGVKLGKYSWPNDVTTRRVQTRASLLVFASAALGPESAKDSVTGYNILTPPYLTYASWSSKPWKKGADPSLYGNVDARYNGRAVCVFLDGSIQMLTIEELRDMRRWSRNAAELDDPNYQIPDSIENY
ncbi:MAG TPA: type II secretion system protein [Chthoniobacteraceae bacterium]|nr:type II secretion system protein [Chthoniobacteraceae bacterium]